MKIKKFQEGGQMPAGGAPEGAPQGGEDPLAQILQVAAEALQTQNCEAAMAVCEGLMMLAQGGGGEQAPQGAPVFKKGGKLKKKGGCKK